MIYVYDSMSKCLLTSSNAPIVRLYSLPQVLAFMWMTRATNGNVPGWGRYFHGYAGDGTVSVSFL